MRKRHNEARGREEEEKKWCFFLAWGEERALEGQAGHRACPALENETIFFAAVVACIVAIYSGLVVGSDGCFRSNSAL